MTITVYTFIYNEEVILPYFLNHYSKFVDKIIVYDNMSTDNSINILKDWKDTPIEIRTMDTKDTFDEETLMDLRNNCWKDDTSDYIIVCDVDEFIYNEDIRTFLKKHSFMDYFTPSGYHMIGNKTPKDTTKQLTDVIKKGVEDVNYGKNVLFKRVNVKETYYAPGAHLSSFVGKKPLINCTTDKLKLLHYKWLSPEYVLSNYKRNQQRMSEHSKENNWGLHYFLTDEEILNKFNNYKKQSKKVI
jgi:glycosyltransferase involved in cell wall biosynthesis